METLDQIGVKHQTDKSSTHHNYLQFYDLLFTPMRLHRIALLEIGIQFCNSIYTWREYFPNAIIHGMDTVDNNGRRVEGTEFFFRDAYTDPTGMGLYDIIIDDASHKEEDQVFFITHYSIHCTYMMIVEDVLKRETVAKLVAALPKGWLHSAVEMSEGMGKSWVDSRLFIAWRKL